MSSRQLIEIASWRLATELLRRHPQTWRLTETHPGGGLYDCLTLRPRDGIVALPQVWMNRVGSVHVESASGTERFERFWDRYTAADEPKLLVDQLDAAAGLVPPARLPASTPEVLTYRVISGFLTTTVFDRSAWQCRSGILDTSGWAVGVRDTYFAETLALAGPQLRVTEEDAGDYWFILRDGSAVSCFHAPAATAWCGGHRTDLFAAYRVRRRLWDAVHAALHEILP